MLCDFSFKTATFSKPADPGRNDLDEQKTDNDRENNDEIEIVVRHCPCVSVRRQSNAGAAMKWGKNCGIGDRFPEES